MSARPRPLVAVALIGVIGAGCGSNGPSAGSGGTAGAGTATTAASAGTKTTTGQDRAVKFAECIRAHDVPDFPDPDTKGEFMYGVSVTPAVWQRAVNACRDLQPPGALSARRKPEQQAAALRFARCIRTHGVKDFPDPANGEPLVDTTRIPSSNRPGGMTVLNAAMQRCGSLVRAAMGGRG